LKGTLSCTPVRHLTLLIIHATWEDWVQKVPRSGKLQSLESPALIGEKTPPSFEIAKINTAPGCAPPHRGLFFCCHGHRAAAWRPSIIFTAR
jgi:hypothetical protein